MHHGYGIGSNDAYFENCFYTKIYNNRHCNDPNDGANLEYTYEYFGE